MRKKLTRAALISSRNSAARAPGSLASLMLLETGTTRPNPRESRAALQTSSGLPPCLPTPAGPVEKEKIKFDKIRPVSHSKKMDFPGCPTDRHHHYHAAMLQPIRNGRKSGHFPPAFSFLEQMVNHAWLSFKRWCGKRGDQVLIFGEPPCTMRAKPPHKA